MVNEIETVLLGDLALEFLDALVEEFQHSPGIEIDHMVMVIVARELINGMTVVEVVPRHQTRRLELRQYSVHGREANAFVGLDQPSVDIFRRQVMGIRLLENLENLKSRDRDFESSFFQFSVVQG